MKKEDLTETYNGVTFTVGDVIMYDWDLSKYLAKIDSDWDDDTGIGDKSNSKSNSKSNNKLILIANDILILETGVNGYDLGTDWGIKQVFNHKTEVTNPVNFGNVTIEYIKDKLPEYFV